MMMTGGALIESVLIESVPVESVLIEFANLALNKAICNSQITVIYRLKQSKGVKRRLDFRLWLQAFGELNSQTA